MSVILTTGLQTQKTSQGPEHPAHLPGPALMGGGLFHCSRAKSVQEATCVSVSFMYTAESTLSSNRVLQHVSCVLTGGSARRSSGGIRLMMLRPCFVCLSCLSEVGVTPASFRGSVSGPHRKYIPGNSAASSKPTLILSFHRRGNLSGVQCFHIL